MMGTKPSGASQRPSSARCQSGGMKSHAVFADGSGMPGVSGDEKLSGPPMSGRFAKLPGVVPWPVVEGFPPWAGGSMRVSMVISDAPHV